MNYTISVLRRERNAQDSFWQSFSYSPLTENDTVATALSRLNTAVGISFFTAIWAFPSKRPITP